MLYKQRFDKRVIEPEEPMKIKVNRRTRDDGALVFEIVVTEPHLAPFEEDEKAMMDVLQEAKRKVDNISIPENKTRIDVEQGIHWSKSKVFDRVLANLRFAIKNQLEPKFNPICQEIYNWIQDNQRDILKHWMSEFDPQRSKYYFDNDQNIEKDDFEDDDEEDEDEDE